MQTSSIFKAPGLHVPRQQRKLDAGKRIAFHIHAAASTGASLITEVGSISQQGVTRKQNEDRVAIDVRLSDYPPSITPR